MENRFKIDILKLEIIANMLTLESKNGYYYKVESCWQDYGAGLLWYTIICHNPKENPNSIMESWQILSPRDHNMIMNCETPYDFADMVRTIQSKEFFLDK